MSSVYARPGAGGAPKKAEKESFYSKVVNNPAFPIVFNLGLFAVCWILLMMKMAQDQKDWI